MSTLISAGQLPPNRHDDLDNYNVNDFDDPFATPSPPSSPKKRKEPSSQGLGIDEEVSVQKRARAPNVKLDEDRLLGPAGLPRLRQRARDLKIKGKGHEFSDAARLLSFYQMWLDDLFPKAKFLDALAMVERAGHKKRVIIARNEFLDEGKARARDGGDEDEAFGLGSPSGNARPDGEAVMTPLDPGDKPRTPIGDNDVPDGEDLYDATPRVARIRPRNDVPDAEDDLDALIAEAEGHDNAPSTDKHAQRPAGEVDKEDDLDALIAEAETRDQGHQESPQKGANGDETNVDFADEEAAMQEMDWQW
ncbi:chromosome segregation in meiosis-related protein [Conoideocrella luteorostrata]|uniref:Chromosome segregation in meiosis protein n=1 Tax=Conoideocrella luteorostrata TaxID=1105319 RepID=A0AAJ0CEI4_9HYPO|nr:chromosome segregation in meiosis-related protein [Conoideocrella luteorostrata]